MKQMLIAATAGLMLAACGTSYAGDGKCPDRQMRGHGKMETCRQADEIDQLLMLVLAPEGNSRKPHGPMPGKGGPQGQCPMLGKPQEQCPMMGKGGMGKGGEMRHGRQGGNEAMMLKAYLQEKYPEELKEIAALKKDSDETAKKVIEKFKTLVDKAGAELKEKREKAIAEHQKTVEMIEEYKKTKDAKLGEEIKAKLGEFYDKRLEFMKKKIEHDAERVQKDKEKLEELSKNKDQEISKQLEQITK